MFTKDLQDALNDGVRYLVVEPVNEMTGYDFPAHSIVHLADDNPGAFQNLDKILGTASHIILCELPLLPKGHVIARAARDGRVVLITCTPDAFREWWNHCQPYSAKLLAAGSADPRRLDS
jgi:hypothetical protein